MNGHRTSRIRHRECGFTLLEVLLAVSIFAIVSGVTYFTFSAATTAWRRGVDMTDKIHHADFAVDQIVMALRSMYYPATGGDAVYGFWHGDEGSGPDSADMMSWVKLGSSLVKRSEAGGQHRVKITMEPDDDGKDAIMVRSWGLLQEVEDFDPDDIPPKRYGMRIVGMDCRFEDPEAEFEDEIEWIDEWELSNTIPRAVEITVFLEPLEERERPIEVKRFVEIPLGESVWGPRRTSTIAGGSSGGEDGGSNQGGQGASGGSGSTAIPPANENSGASRMTGTTRVTPNSP